MQKKRILAALLSAAMVMSFVPSVFAEDATIQYSTNNTEWTTVDTLSAAVSAIGKQTGTIKLSGDIVLSEGIKIEGSITVIPEEGKSATIKRGFANGTDSSYSTVGDAMFHVTKSLTLGTEGTGTLILDGNKNTYGESCKGSIVYVSGTTNSHAKLTLNNVNLRNNKTSDTGGAVYAYNWSEINANNVVIESNEAKQGGGIYLYDNNGLTTDGEPLAFSIENSSIKNNSAMESGGGVYLRSGTNKQVFKNVTFEGNAAKYGSAVDVESYAYNNTGKAVDESFVIDGCSFKNNASNYDAEPEWYESAAFVYQYSSSIYFQKPTHRTDRQIVLKGSNIFENLTNADICTYCYGFDGEEDHGVIYVDSDFRITGDNPVRIMNGAYAIASDGGKSVLNKTIFKSGDSAEKLNGLFELVQDEWGKCNPVIPVEFKEDESGNIKIVEKTRKVTIAETVNGTVEVDGAENLDEVVVGTKLTIKANPNPTYAVKEIKVIETDGEQVVELGEDNTFTMPEYDVTVFVVFDFNFTDSVGVYFVQQPDNTRAYSIYLRSSDEKLINRLNTVDLTFINNGDVKYQISEVVDSNIEIIRKEDNPDRYEFNYKTKDKETVGTADTSNEIKIGVVEFIGYGKLDFKVNDFEGDMDNTNVVHATKAANNIVSDYLPNGDVGKGEGHLTYNSNFSEDESYLGTITGEIAADTVPVQINLMFPNEVNTTNDVDYTAMTVEVNGGVTMGGSALVPYSAKIDLGSESTLTPAECAKVETANFKYDSVNDNVEEVTEATDANANGYKITLNVPVPENTGSRYTFKFTGAGYRTYSVDAVIKSEPEGETIKTHMINVWNNVMDHDITVTESDGFDAVKLPVTFLAGDIVGDNNINLYDLSAVVAYFGKDKIQDSKTDIEKYVQYDLNRDGQIDSKDIAMVLVSWGK